jgi:3-deoxy-7-phosphoheptulonate synthase
VNEFAMRRTWGPLQKYPRVLEYDPGEVDFIKIAGPCSIESREQIRSLAAKIQPAGATHLRGGLFRAGTYPSDNFGWVDKELIKQARYAADIYGLENIVEVLDYGDLQNLHFIFAHANCLQVGARQMQNYTLLKILAETKKTIFLKRNQGATIDEWLGAAEYILKYGGKPVLIERGGSSYHTHVRWDLSISIIPAVKQITKIPIIVDAAHGTGRRDLVAPMTLAGVAAGADGCLVEVHHEPKESLSDPDQAITPADYTELMIRVNHLRRALTCDV